jgi:D-alanyl-D-alanine carboxypeptidase
MTQRILFLIAIVFSFHHVVAQQSTVIGRIDSLLKAPAANPFNGVVVISNDGKMLYRKAAGYADFELKKPVTNESEFIIGSISKQVTAVVVLQEVDKGHIHLNDTIRKYLPELMEKWADSVTIHHLLTHTHGIIGLGKPLAFTPGTRFQYGFMGYELLSQIAERTSGQAFPDLCNALFKQCGMQHSSHPRTKSYKTLCKGYRMEDDVRKAEPSLLDVFAAAGGLISSGEDLVKWNEHLHGGELLSDTVYQLMISKKENAFRDHAILGMIDYGYGVTIPHQISVPELGVTGVAQGFIAIDMYYPFTKTSVVVLENIATDLKDLKNSFYYHEQILKIVRSAQ